MTMASMQSESIMEVWGQNCQRGPGAEATVTDQLIDSGGSGGKALLKMKAFRPFGRKEGGGAKLTI